VHPNHLWLLGYKAPQLLPILGVSFEVISHNVTDLAPMAQTGTV